MRALLAILVGWTLGSAAALAQEEVAPTAAQDDLALLAHKANNPLSDVWLLITQNDYTYFDGDLTEGTRQVNSFKFQPVMPVPVLDGEWNLIFRPVLPG